MASPKNLAPEAAKKITKAEVEGADPGGKAANTEKNTEKRGQDEKAGEDAKRSSLARAQALNMPISMKHSVEISRHLRYHSVRYAKQFLEEVISLKKAVPFRRFRRDVGHKRGMASGRFPQKAAGAFLRLIKDAEANSQVLGMDPSRLKIQTLVSNQAAVPFFGGRRRHGTKRTHLRIEVKEVPTKKGSGKGFRKGRFRGSEQEKVTEK